MTADIIDPSDNLRGANVVEIGKPSNKNKRARKADTEDVESNKRVDVLDQIDGQLRFARGIGLAVMGEAEIGGWDSSDISELIDEHIRRLKYVRELVESVLTT